MIAIHMVDMDDVRDMLARREMLARMRDLLSVGEVATGSFLTNEIDRLDVETLTVQSVQEAKLAAYRDGLQTMETCA